MIIGIISAVIAALVIFPLFSCLDKKHSKYQYGILKTGKSTLIIGIITDCVSILFCTSWLWADENKLTDSIIGIMILIAGLFLILVYRNYRFYFNGETFYQHGFFRKNSVYKYSDIKTVKVNYDIITLEFYNNKKLCMTADFYPNLGEFIKELETHVKIKYIDEDEED